MCLAIIFLTILWVGYAAVGRRWRIEPRLDAPIQAPMVGRVVAVIPARNEAVELPRTLPSLLSQSHPDLRIVLVDDHSEDGTADVARRIAQDLQASDKLIVLASCDLPPGWTGKVWAQSQGVEEAARLGAEWIWFTDADIRHDRDVLQRLLTTADFHHRDFVSIMARLRCQNIFEKLLIPAFTYFFAALYPFSRIGDDGSESAGAAGGCMLVRASTLERAGGIEIIRTAVIDDVALGRACKQSGARLWLGYHDGVNSTRGYENLASVWDMVARSAYTQLNYNPLALIGCVLGLLFVFVLPVVALFTSNGWTWLLALLIYAAMTRTYGPMVNYLGCHPIWAVWLPLSATLYLAMTITSAWRYHRGTGNAWKGRAYDQSPS